jgi:hypothetical protein
MKISVSAMACFLSIAVFCGTTQAQENLGTYVGKINTTIIDLPTIPAQETIVILSNPLQDPSDAIPFESNPFNLRIVAKNRLRTPGEIEIDSATPVESTSSAVLQSWWICDVNTQMNCEVCYPNENLPPQRPFPSDVIRGCLVDTHIAEGEPHNLLALPLDPSFTPAQTTIQKGATFTGTIDADKKLLTLIIEGMTSFEYSFESKIEAKLK